MQDRTPTWLYYCYGIALILLAIDSGSILFDSSTGIGARILGAAINFGIGFGVLGLIAYVLSFLFKKRKS